MPEGRDRQSLELALLVAKANALLPLKGYSTPQTVGALSAAKQLIEAGVGDDLQHFAVLYGLCAAKYVALELEAARALAGQFVDLADRRKDPTYRLVGHRLLGTVQFLMGRNREALDNLQQAEGYRDPAPQKQLSYRFGYDPGIILLCYKAMTLFMLGLPEQAARASDQALMEAADHYHAPTVGLCRFFTLIWPDPLAILKRASATAPNSSNIASKKRWSSFDCTASSVTLALGRDAVRRLNISSRSAPRSPPITTPALVYTTP